jgi:DNA-binding response OmpR family regulator
MNQGELARILVIEDDPYVARTIERCLHSDRFSVTLISDGFAGLEITRQSLPDLVILDVIMSGIDGYSICRAIRADPLIAQVPVLFLTAKIKLEDKITGFRAGADDYLCKPFNLDELLLRVRAVLRRSMDPDRFAHLAPAESFEITSPLRSSSSGQPLLAIGEYVLDTRTYELATPSLGKVRLTPLQYDLLYFLMTHPGKTFSPGHLLSEVWDYPSGQGSPDLVRVHIKTLRERIEESPNQPTFLCTVPGKGYTIYAEPNQTTDK